MSFFNRLLKNIGTVAKYQAEATAAAMVETALAELPETVTVSRPNQRDRVVFAGRRLKQKLAFDSRLRELTVPSTRDLRTRNNQGRASDNDLDVNYADGARNYDDGARND